MNHVELISTFVPFQSSRIEPDKSVQTLTTTTTTTEKKELIKKKNPMSSPIFVITKFIEIKYKIISIVLP